jgi:hypothetical protein
MSLTNHPTDAVPGSFHGWTIAEAIERTIEPDYLTASANEDENSTGAKQNAMLKRLFKGELVVTGCFDAPTAPPVAVDPQNFHGLQWSGPRSSTLIGTAGSEVEIFNVRVFPVLRAPNAADHLNGLPLTEAFRRYVIGDPEVIVLAKHVLKAHPGEAAVFQEGKAPGPIIDFHWPLHSAASAIAYQFVATHLFIDGDQLPRPSASISAVSEVLADRIAGLRDILVGGRIVAFGAFAQTGVEGPIGRLQWLRKGISIDVSNGDLCEGDDYRAVAKWTGLSLWLPKAPLPTNQPQNVMTEQPRKAREQIQNKEKPLKECIVWLEIMMSDPEIVPRSIDDLWAEARSKWPKKFTKRAFLKAREYVIIKTEASAWKVPGPKPKSSHS